MLAFGVDNAAYASYWAYGLEEHVPHRQIICAANDAFSVRFDKCLGGARFLVWEEEDGFPA